MNFKVILSDEELGLTALDELMKMTLDFLKSSKQEGKGRKTRSANKKSDDLYQQIKNFKLPPIRVIPDEPPQPPPTKLSKETNSRQPSTDSCISVVSESESSRPITRSLRSRSKSPSIVQQQQLPPSQPQSGRSTPSRTPQNQRLRGANTKQATTPSRSGSSNSVSYASATKLRQALRVNSAQKRKEEERERQERIMLERRAKEERAEAQKKQLLEERAIKAKQKREERINHAAELRRAREQAQMLKKREEQRRAEMLAAEQQVAEQDEVKPPKEALEIEELQPIRAITPLQQLNTKQHKQDITQPLPQPPVTPPKSSQINETFKVPDAVNNIDIIIQDETDDGTAEKNPHIAAWAKAPQLRNALISQYSRDYKERMLIASMAIGPLRPIGEIDLKEIFGDAPINRKYLVRTSSAVWTPPNRSIKRTSSQVTPSS